MTTGAAVCFCGRHTRLRGRNSDKRDLTVLDLIERLDLKKNSGNSQSTQHPYSFVSCSAEEVENLYRSLEDLSPTHLRDFPADLVVQFGYRYTTSVVQTPIRIPQRSAVIAVRNVQGRIVALHDHRLSWFTQPAIHIANSRRMQWTREVQIYPDTVHADVNALSGNFAAIGLNGFSLKHVRSLVGSHIKLIDRRVVSSYSKGIAA